MGKVMKINKIGIMAGLVALLFCSCRERELLSQRMVESEMRRCPTAADLDGMNGRLKWNYTTGLELLAFLDAADNYGFGNKAAARGKGPGGDPQGADHPGIASPKSDAPAAAGKGPGGDPQEIYAYVDAWYDAIIREDGSVGANYKRANYNLDHICPARTLFKLYDITGRQKYRAALDSIYLQVQRQPRTEAGPFWHKAVYPHQVWLDGFYMAEPFYAQYSATCLNSTHEKYVNFDDIADQFRVAWSKCYDYSTGLLRHAWDEDGGMFWSDPYTGQSAHSWGRAMGWYTMALVDVLDFMPEDHPARKDLLGMLRTILETLPRYADKKTGMWYQVLDCPGREGNYIESTCSSMFTYAYLKAAARQWISREWLSFARKSYKNLVRAFIREDSDGTISLTQCCAVAGLGGKEHRSGDYDYYINEKITENDPKGVGPFIWASLIYEQL